MDEFLKQIGWALLEWAKLNRFPFSVVVAVLFGLLAYIVVPFMPGKPPETPPATSTTIEQKSGDNSSCSNMTATGNGSVNCSVSPEDQQHALPKNQPTNHK